MAWVEAKGSGFRVRYRRPDGTIGTENGFHTRPAARKRAAQIDADPSAQHAGLPDTTAPTVVTGSTVQTAPPPAPAPSPAQQPGPVAAGAPSAASMMPHNQRPTRLQRPAVRQATSMTLGEWVTLWSQAQRLSPNTAVTYESHLRLHILPAFGTTPLEQITRIAVKSWATSLADTLSSASVASIVTLLSTLLNEAAGNGLIPANPCQRLRLPKKNKQEKVHATALQVLQIAARLDPNPALLVITGAYTGMRWGELVGLAWANVLLDEQIPGLRIDPDNGSLHEIAGQVFLDGPKTQASVRTVAIPPFLAAMFQAASRVARTDYVFTSEQAGWLRRSNFRQRLWDPAVDGNPAALDPDLRTPIAPGMTFHGLRHTHKTWMTEDAIAEFVQNHRLGHHTPGIGARYTHITPTMTREVIDKMQARYQGTLPQYTALPRPLPHAA